MSHRLNENLHIFAWPFSEIEINKNYNNYKFILDT